MDVDRTGLGCIAAIELDLRGRCLRPTIEEAKTLGGSYVFVHTVPRAGRIGLVKDPGGALFVIRGPVPA
jgi:hypothetical protein